ncbi:ABC transporter substrate-binding protein [Bradyrhizobium sp. U87765 SZCCT0131]|uniref:ABC transporter substrate-binding protein n=1 Tax=unclassified Bradyrhizobium TaxID=2631580 RepID=UPI001BA4E369|nr:MULTISPECIES: ABC transporter substrate-binding protein [unclassified Bradyrhizobium]MBR1222368.1 ABC transporter substrate-binding protein [Bradyrhizobium sp. U87765 SZCCT0131]MBR1264148.1 ABC transporter substrate-binding protein [Bradyrhizobium sp. U87765 SZCCT0134]MBR1308069.1 ABC transporter substrate-binding protein [Bradyrhizobium sp. U87765 SZCCT0110]MBR1320398.1 ABC transporter substrate-binding protein [Bradyrhizobium sp. U87765 SZCCT0109]MBR1348489.1 ABC transporter substrate-bin
MLKKWAGVAATLSCLAATSFTGPAAAETNVKFMLDFISLGRHTPWYVALEKGYFKEEGLNVEIMPSKGTADAIRGVVTGISQMGLIDVPSLVAAGKAGSDVKIVAGAYVEAPYCVYTLNPGANVTKPTQLEGLKFGSSSASFIPQIWRAFMHMNGLDGSKLEIVNVDAAARIPMLAAGQVEGVDQFLMAAPAIRRAAPGKQPVCLFAADYGLDLYSNSIGVKKSFLDENPEAVRGFVRAALRGWQYTLAHRDEAAAIMVKSVPALDRGIVREEIDLLERIAVNTDVKVNGFGHILPEKMAKTFDFINANVQVNGGKLEANQTYVPGFMPKTPILPEQK